MLPIFQDIVQAFLKGSPGHRRAHAMSDQEKKRSIDIDTDLSGALSTTRRITRRFSGLISVSGICL